MFSKQGKSDIQGDVPSAAPRSKNAMPSLVSSDLSIIGDITGDADIQIEGRIEGNIKSRALTIGNTGEVKGKVVADDVMISGSFDGQMNAGSVKLAASARVKGDITVREALSIETGAKFEGQCKRVTVPEKLHGDKFSGDKKQGSNVAPQKATAIR
jgi:cytoskeletal protein CcmA (bactofilin family)